ncbi:intradiol ring-cleavage dioxygenase [Chryseobacterium sp. G0240]|nr:intradiol ring-cleavage dioxygenase [Chryseobacterium sp. G0240]
MNRKGFLKSLGLAGVTAIAAPLLIHCGNDDDIEGSSSGTAAGSGSGSTGCSVTNTETEGPFPTKSPSSLVQSNIVSDRTGVPFTITITVQNVNAACATLQGALVDIWHCDKDGNYSEYGGTGMQPANYTNVHFLRGRQTTDVNGQVNFTSIFPGWYNGRATHIHVHIYNAAGQSLLVTQIAFPEGSDSAVVQVAASTGYKGMTGYTYNANDNVFSDGTSNEMSSISGSVSGGFALTHTIKVPA